MAQAPARPRLLRGGEEALNVEKIFYRGLSRVEGAPRTSNTLPLLGEGANRKSCPYRLAWINPQMFNRIFCNL